MQGVKILPVHKGKGKRGVSAHGRNPAGSCRHKNKKCSSRGKRQEGPPDLTYLKSISRERPGRGGLQVLYLGEVLFCRSLGQPLFLVLLPQPSLSLSLPLILLFTAVLFSQFFFISPGLSNSSAAERFSSLDIPAPHALVMCVFHTI